MTSSLHTRPEQLLEVQGVESFDASCNQCGRRWQGTGTINARRAARQAQRHADRTLHIITAEWADRR